jgi:hypothetical protein
MDSLLIVDTATGTLRESLTATIEFLPTLVMAVCILIIGTAIAFVVGRIAGELVEYINLDSRAVNSPIAALFAGQPRIAALTSTAVKAYGVLVALSLAAGYAGLTGLTAWLNQLVDYVPQLLGGLAIIVAGFLISAYAITAAKRTTSGLTQVVVVPVLQGLLYFMVVVVGVDTMGFDVQIIYVVGEMLSIALGLGLALALGLALGHGSKEYVANHVEQWADGTEATAGSGSTDSDVVADTTGGGMDDGMGSDDMADDEMADDWDDDGGMDDDWDDDGGMDDDWDDDGVEDLSDGDWEDDF